MAKNKNNKIISLKEYSKRIAILLGSIVALILLLSIAIVVLVGLFPDLLVVHIILSAILAVSAIVFVTLAILFINKLYFLFYKQGIEVFKRNIESLSNFDKNFEYYKEDNFEELKDLNSTFKEIAKNVDGRTIISQGLMHKDIELDYVDKNHIFVKEESLLSNLNNLIISSESYKNALIDISYDLGDGVISSKDENNILKTLKMTLGYENILIASKDNHQGYILYIPAFDSLNQLKEELEYLIKNISLLNRTPQSKELVLANVSVVVYPYSSIDNMRKDLEKAKKEKKILNFYLPERPFEPNNKLLFSSMNINNTTKLIEDVSSIDPDPKQFEKNMKKIETSISNISNYYGFSSAGYIDYDEENEIYISRYAYSSEEAIIFKENSKVNSKFIDILMKIQDNDHSYYFSNRRHINIEVAKYIDEYRIKSGLFYILTRDDKPIGVIYFVNRQRDLNFDAYMKESLITSCHVLSGILKEIGARKSVDISNRRLKEVLKISGIKLYSVNKESYELIMASESLKRSIGKLDASLPCYKAIYGLEKPCKNCPLKSGKHSIMNISNKKYESYPILQNKNDPTAHIVLKETSKEEGDSLINDETLLASFSSLSKAIENKLIAKQSGDILLFRIKNASEIANKFGNNGLTELIKSLVSEVLSKYVMINDIYEYDYSTLAIVLNGSSRDYITSLCEDIYSLTNSLTKEDTKLSLLYYDKSYSDNDNLKDLFKSLDDSLLNYKDESDNEIIFIDSGYKRSASKDGYLLEQLLKSFNEKSYDMHFQPMLSNNTRLIYGAELLLRVNDNEIGKPINIGEAIRIAEETGNGKVVCEGLLTYLDDLLTKYGYTFFMSAGLARLSLNVDYDFISSDGFIDRLSELVKKHQLPKTFIGFEIFEKDVKKHLSEYKELSKKIADAGAVLISDYFTGEAFSVKEASEAGFKEIKIPYNLVSKITENSVYEKLISFWDEASKNQMKITFVGVENRRVSEAINYEGHDCNVQGNYFFKAMKEEELFEAVRLRNMKDKDNLDN